MRRFVIMLIVLLCLFSIGIVVYAQESTAEAENPEIATQEVEPQDTETTEVTAQDAEAQAVVHVVVAGENLYRISLRYGVTIAALVQTNNISNPNLIFVGQRITISGSSTEPPPPTPEPEPDPTAEPTEPPSDGDAVVYIVQRGDTLSAIARRYGTSYLTIAANNGISNPNLIYVGQKLTIYGTPPTEPPATDEPPATEPPATDEPPVTDEPPATDEPITGFNLGGHVTDASYPRVDDMRRAGMTWTKRQIRWSQGMDITTIQNEINIAHEGNFRILLSVVGTNPQEIAANPAQYYQDFGAFLGQLAASGADAIEVWNEPNIDREWPAGLIGGAQYTQMLSAAYQIIKANNPNTFVISAAPAPTGGLNNTSTGGYNDDQFLRDMANAGAAQFMDCVGIHYNVGTTPPSQSWGAPVDSHTHYTWYYQPMVNLYTDIFPSRPLCFTEIGYLSGEGYPQIPENFRWASGNTVAEQAQWLAEAAVLARDSRTVRLFIVWNVDSTVYTDDPQAGYAIVRPDGSCPACDTLGAIFN